MKAIIVFIQESRKKNRLTQEDLDKFGAVPAVIIALLAFYYQRRRHELQAPE